MCSGFLQSCLEPLEGVLKQAGLTKDDIQKVGGYSASFGSGCFGLFFGES